MYKLARAHAHQNWANEEKSVFLHILLLYLALELLLFTLLPCESTIILHHTLIPEPMFTLRLHCVALLRVALQHTQRKLYE